MADEKVQVSLPTTTKMDAGLNTRLSSVNPTGSGSFSLNRKDGTSIGEYSVSVGYNSEAQGESAHAEGIGTAAVRRGQSALGTYNIRDDDFTPQDLSIGGSSSWTGAAKTEFDVGSNHEIVSLTEVTVAGTDVTSTCYFKDGHTVVIPSGYSSGQTVMIYYVGYVLDEKHYLQIVGNGTSDTQRSNAYTLDSEGNAWFAGDITMTDSAGETFSMKDFHAEGSKINKLNLQEVEFVDVPTSMTDLDGVLAIEHGGTGADNAESARSNLGAATARSITEGTAGTSSATNGSTLEIPYITMASDGTITGYGTHTHTITGFLSSGNSGDQVTYSLSGSTLTITTK